MYFNILHVGIGLRTFVALSTAGNQFVTSCNLDNLIQTRLTY